MRKTLTYFMILFMLFSCNNKNSYSFYDKKLNENIEDVKAFKFDETEKIVSLLEPYIYVFDSKKKIKIGDSKFGGTPDLPQSLNWPKFNNNPMVFFGQINLEHISFLHKNEYLPKEGILYFFSYFKNPENEYGAEYLFQIPKTEYKVLYYAGSISDLRKTKFPKELIKKYQFKQTAIEYELDFRLPCSNFGWKYQQASFTDNDKSTMTEFIERFDDYCMSEVILGIPAPIQDDLEYDWSYAYLESLDYHNEEIKEQVNILRPQFINLFSFSMYDRFDTIGISECYFGIKKEDLKNKDFDKTIFVMQGT
ncbi:DUF1963 domain-containing protein [Psychroserpens ponticola]|uniref:YwqG family protein n=1 Tax=Psychroserpens ponticola TaxID=2932268 RepID=A0ABY7S364_9FLAO|nr:YwqG family protein [Psychroserpens ponticola]WCO03583.1 YwqG family protein [Psychroserpens ponticola]